MSSKRYWYWFFLLEMKSIRALEALSMEYLGYKSSIILKYTIY